MAGEKQQEDPLKSRKEAAAERAQVPKMSLGYSVAMLALGLLVVREYDTAWRVISITASISVLFLLVAVSAFSVRLIALKNIETIGSRERLHGVEIDPHGEEIQRKLKERIDYYDLSGIICLPAFAIGAVLIAISMVLVILYHIVGGF